MTHDVKLGKAVPLQAWTGPSGFMSLRLPEFLDNQHMKLARLSPLRTDRLYPQEITLAIIYVRCWTQDHSAVGRIKAMTVNESNRESNSRPSGL